MYSNSTVLLLVDYRSCLLFAGDTGRTPAAASKLGPSLTSRHSADRNAGPPPIDALIASRRTRWDTGSSGASSQAASEQSSAIAGGPSPRHGSGSSGAGPGAGVPVENLCVLDEELPLTSLVSPLVGVEALTRSIERLASRHPAFRHLRAYVPETWHVVRRKLKNLRRLHSGITEIQVFAGTPRVPRPLPIFGVNTVRVLVLIVPTDC